MLYSNISLVSLEKIKIENKPMEEGFIAVNKPKGITSFKVIYVLRKITGIKKIGHCGTLDPLASGVLVCAIGRSATRKIDEFKDQDKVYLAEIELGKESDTYDLEGEIRQNIITKKLKVSELKNVLKKYTGEFLQMPPVYSAKKIGGVRAYKLARKGDIVEMKKSKVTIKKIKIISYHFPFLKIEISCGKGTYIRSLANDIGKDLGCGAVLCNLERTCVGKIRLKDSIPLDKINENNWENFLLKNFLLKN